MIVTPHGKNRLKERLGVPKRSALRHAKEAFEKGSIAADVFGGYRHKQNANLDVMYVYHNTYIYVYGYDFKLEMPTLLTAYPPNRRLM